MAKDILKEAIADAKAVREVALANAKAALEEAFTPKLQSMLSAKLSEDLDEEMYDEDMDEMMYDEDMDEGHGEMHDEDMDEMMHDEDMDEMMYDEDMDEDMDEDRDEEKLEMGETYGMDEEDSMDEEIDLEEILNELELEENDSEETLEETPRPNYKAEYASDVTYKANHVNQGLNESFDLDALLEEINNLDEKKDEDDVKEAKDDMDEKKDDVKEVKGCGCQQENILNKTLTAKLNETTSTLQTVKAELNEVNLLNSKLLYVNRIFKANNLDDSQKLRVVETLDKADSTKEAKLIYETIKDTFNVANTKKESVKNKTKSLREGIGMASKAAGTSTAPKKEIISESNDMMKRFQKLANIKINQ